MATQTKKKSNAPIYKKRHGRLQVTVFENLSDDGKIRFSTYIQRSYKADNGQWKVGGLSEEDLDDLTNARQLAVQQIQERKTRYSNQQLK